MTDRRPTGGRFSATEAAFTGFRLMAREPATVGVWAGLYLLFTLVVSGGMVLTVGPTMGAVIAQQRAGLAPDPTASFAMMSRLLPFEGLVLVLALGFYAVMFAAVSRAVLRPGAGGPGRIALGGDEGRQLLLGVILGVLFFVAYLVLVVVAAIVAVVLGFALAAGHAAAGASPGPVVGLIFASIAVVLLVLAALATRLSLASPLTFDTARIDVFGSWRLTRGIFWPLFGAYVLVWLTCLVLLLVAAVVFAAVMAGTGGGLAAAGVMFRPDMSSLGAYFAPAMILWMLMMTAVGTVTLALMLAAPVGAYAQLKALGRVAAEGPPGGAPTGPAAAPPTSDLPRFGR